MTSKNGPMMSRKFRGCLVGALLGDCLGYVYEDRLRPSKVELEKFFDSLEGRTNQDAGRLLPYTDDTAMTMCIAESLIAHGKVNPKDLAKRYVEEYFADPNRYYGGHVIFVFSMLRDSNCEDPFGPGREQFNGAGSFGNGGAMRISPIALFFRGKSIAVLGEAVRQATEITHSHVNGYNGAILQCLAIEQCLWLDPNQHLNVSSFLEELITKMQNFENGDDDSTAEGGTAQPFCNKLRWAKEVLEKEAKVSEQYDINDDDVLEHLGSGISALSSVPTAIFCFLRAQQGPIPGINTMNPLRRTIQYAISLGGDTDTVASMAGAICGAYLGYNAEVFNENVMSHCEGLKKSIAVAAKLYDRKKSKLCHVF